MTVAPPPEDVQGIRLREVRAALRHLKPGPYYPSVLYSRYMSACRAAGYVGGYRTAFGRALNALGVPRAEYHPDLGAAGRWIDPAVLFSSESGPQPPPRPTPRLMPMTADEVRQAVLGLKPGWYKSADLIGWFDAWCANNGRPPMTVQLLGTVLRRTEVLEMGWTRGHVRIWRVPQHPAKR